MSQPSLRKSLSAPGLLREVRRCFQAIKDDAAGRGLALTDCLMSGLAVFGLKHPSLLQFDRGRADEMVRSNLRSLHEIARAPSDTALRERLDGVASPLLWRAFWRVFQLVQRGKALAKEGYKRYFREKLRSFFFTWLLPDWKPCIRPLPTVRRGPWPGSSGWRTSRETKPNEDNRG